MSAPHQFLFIDSPPQNLMISLCGIRIRNSCSCSRFQVARAQFLADCGGLAKLRSVKHLIRSAVQACLLVAGLCVALEAKAQEGGIGLRCDGDSVVLADGRDLSYDKFAYISVSIEEGYVWVSGLSMFGPEALTEYYGVIEWVDGDNSLILNQLTGAMYFDLPAKIEGMRVIFRGNCTRTEAFF